MLINPRILHKPNEVLSNLYNPTKASKTSLQLSAINSTPLSSIPPLSLKGEGLAINLGDPENPKMTCAKVKGGSKAITVSLKFN